MSGQRTWKLLRRDDGIDVLQQVGDAGPHLFDIDNRRDVRLPRVTRCPDGGCRLVGIDHQDPARNDGIPRDVRGIHDECRIAVPERGAIAGTPVHENDRELVGSTAHDACGADVDAGAGQALSRKCAEVVVAEAADIARAPAEARARNGCRRHLSARKPGKSLKPLFRIRRGVFGDDREQVDAVEAEPDHVKGFAARLGDSKRDTHAARNRIRAGIRSSRRKMPG